MSLPWSLAPPNDQRSGSFRLAIKTKTIDSNNDIAPESLELQLRVSWDHSLQQIIKHVLATTLDEHPGFHSYFEYDNTIIKESQSLNPLHSIPGMEQRAEGVYHCPKLVLVYDYDNVKPSTEVLHELIEKKEFFKLKIVGDISDNLDYQLQQVLTNTVSEIKSDILNTLRIPYSDITISYKGKEAVDEESLLDVLGLDIPPNELTYLHLRARGESTFQFDKTTESCKEKLREKLAEFYTISTGEKTIELSSMDCIIHPNGYLFVNQYAQEAIKKGLNVAQLSPSNNRPASSLEPQWSPGNSHPGYTPQSPNPETHTNSPAAQDELPEQGSGVYVRFAGEAANVNMNVPNQAIGTVVQLFLREINLHIEELAQVFVRLALATVLIGPQRAFYLLQPPLIYFLLVPTISSWLFFYGGLISDWIDQKILEHGNRERIDYTIAKLISQVFRLAYALTICTSSAISGMFKRTLSLMHFNRVDLSNNSSMFGRLKSTVFSLLEFVLVLVASVLPFLGKDSEKFFEEQPHVERQKMQSAILKILNSELGIEAACAALGFRELQTTHEIILSPNISASDYSKLLTIHEKALKFVTQSQRS